MFGAIGRWKYDVVKLFSTTGDILLRVLYVYQSVFSIIVGKTIPSLSHRFCYTVLLLRRLPLPVLQRGHMLCSGRDFAANSMPIQAQVISRRRYAEHNTIYAIWSAETLYEKAVLDTAAVDSALICFFAVTTLTVRSSSSLRREVGSRDELLELGVDLVLRLPDFYCWIALGQN
eukprot:IDg19068t1